MGGFMTVHRVYIRDSSDLYSLLALYEPFPVATFLFVPTLRIFMLSVRLPVSPYHTSLLFRSFGP